MVDDNAEAASPGGDRELEPEAELVALRLADGASHAEAAMEIGRSAKWVQRRLRDDEAFRRRVLAIKSQRVEQAAAGLGALLAEATAVVQRNLHAERPADQLHAARLVFDRYRIFRADTELVDELATLRAELAELRASVAASVDTGSAR